MYRARLHAEHACEAGTQSAGLQRVPLAGRTAHQNRPRGGISARLFEGGEKPGQDQSYRAEQ